MPRFRDRPTVDVVVILMAVIVVFEVVLVTLVAVGGVVSGHGAQVKDLLKSMGELTGSLIALLVGFVAGRGTGGGGDPEG